MPDIQTRADIEILVSRFYHQLLQDEEMAYLFTEVVPLHWGHHIPVICDFWAGILLGERAYQGNPMLKHLDLHRKSPLNARHFERWLHYWTTTVRGRFEGPKADMAIARAEQIAGLMQVKIGRLPPAA